MDREKVNKQRCKKCQKTMPSLGVTGPRLAYASVADDDVHGARYQEVHPVPGVSLQDDEVATVELHGLGTGTLRGCQNMPISVLKKYNGNLLLAPPPGCMLRPRSDFSDLSVT